METLYLSDPKKEATLLNINGELITDAEARLFTTNRAFKYGDGLFETIRIKNGKPLFIEEHYERLCRGIGLLKLVLPKHFSKDYLEKEISRLIKGNKIRKGGRIRLNVYRDSAGLYIPEKDDLAWIMEVEALGNNDFVLNEKGLTLGIYKERRLVPDCFTSIKTVGKLPYVLAGVYARERGWDDCLIENHNGSIMEAVSSNLFLIMGSTFYTPPLADGCMSGVMRKHVINLIKEMGGTVIENSIRPNHLERVDEVFLTNAISGLKWVGAYDQKRYFHKKCDELIDALNRLTV